MAATPRSGSTLLCALLAGTGVAGRPEEYFESLWRTGAPRQPREYFAGVEDPALLALLAPTEPGDPDRSDPFPSALERGTTGNGVFGAKLMWTHRERDGLVNKFEGDAALCVFGAPVAQPDHAAQALACARDLRSRINALESGIDATIGVASGGEAVDAVGDAEAAHWCSDGEVLLRVREHPTRIAMPARTRALASRPS